MAQKDSKIVVVIPAYNEEHWIARTVLLLRQTRIPMEIIVVNDGSTDRTAELAHELGCRVISFEKNLGKSATFFAGAKTALKLNPRATVFMDADMIKVPAKDLSKMIGKVARATARRKSLMVIATVLEGPNIVISLSGIRAFSAPALFRLSSSKIKSIPKRFGLEKFLRDYFPYPMTEKLDSGFIARHAYEHCDRNAQVSDINRVERLAPKIEKRSELKKAMRPPLQTRRKPR